MEEKGKNPLIKNWRTEDEGEEIYNERERIYNKERGPKDLMKTSEELSGLGEKDLIVLDKEVKTHLDVLRKRERLMLESNPSSNDLKEIQVKIEYLVENEKLVEKILAERGINMEDIERKGFYRGRGFYNRETDIKELIGISKKKMSILGEKDFNTLGEKLDTARDILEGKIKIAFESSPDLENQIEELEDKIRSWKKISIKRKRK